MAAPDIFVSLLACFVQCGFTRPGFEHFRAAMLGFCLCAPGERLCLTGLLRTTGWHESKHWTGLHRFMAKGRWSCSRLSLALLRLLVDKLALPAGDDLILVADDTLCKKHGRHFQALGYYPDPTNKNPGAHKTKALGHCHVALGLFVPRLGKWLCLPLGSLLFAPRKNCPPGWAFATKIELVGRLLERLSLASLGRRVVLVVDNLYSKKSLIQKLGKSCGPAGCALVGRLRSDAALHELPARPKKPARGKRRLRGLKLKADQIWRKSSKRELVRAAIYGKEQVEVLVCSGVWVPSRTLGSDPIKVVLFPRRSGRGWNIFFSTDPSMPPQRLLELYAARFKIEQCFKELKHGGGLADCRQRSAKALKRHANLCLLAHSLLALTAATAKGAEQFDAQPWHHPPGLPSAARVRRALRQQGMNLSRFLPGRQKPPENPTPHALAA